MDVVLLVNYPIFMSDFHLTGIVRTEFRIIEYQISRKSVQWEPICSCGLTDRQTDMTNLTVAFRNFANAPKNWLLTNDRAN